MNMTALHAALIAVCPILGVAVVDPNNRATWRIDFDAAATPAQQAAAQAALQAYIDVPVTVGDMAVAVVTNDPFARALIKLLAAQSAQIFSTSQTPAQIITILKGLA